ncbi:MAG TPA: TonB-dependent receptor, partial [Longimicrobiaceae bacterium]|nr:TonB-dependent receptor [Longimicrobiaceae bacterium]
MKAYMSSRTLGTLALAFALVGTVGTARAAIRSPATDSIPAPQTPPVVGVVTDSSGTPLPNARVVITSLQRSTTTDAQGRFRFRALPAGTYHVDVSLLGYAPAHAEVAVPTSGGEVTLQIGLVPTPLTLQGVVVTGTPWATDALRTTQATSQLSGKELDRELGATVAQTLSKQPGIQMRYNGPAASTPVIRGLTGDRVLVLRNGQRTGDLSGAAPDHGLSIDPLSATRVEVVRGPASLLYGSGAIGGVVNVIEEDIPTTVPGSVVGFLALQGESGSPGGGSTAQATAPLSPTLAFTVRGGFRHVGDVRVGGGGTLDNTYLHNYHGNLGLGYVGERVSGGGAFDGYHFDYGLPSPADDSEAGTHIRGARREVKGRLVLPQPASWLSEIRMQGTAQWYHHDEVESSGEIGTRFELGTQTADVRAQTQWGRQRGTVGLSGLFEQYVSTGEEALTPAANSNNVGLLVFQQFPLGRPGELTPQLQVGARYDLYRIQSTDSKRFGAGRSLHWNALSGSAGVNVPLTRGLSVSANVARAFRAPTVEELFSSAFHAAVGAFQLGSAALQPEINNGVEGVLRVQTTKLTARGSLYYNHISGFIAPLRVGDTTVVVDGTSRTVPLDVFSQADAAVHGAEGQAEYALLEEWVIGASGDFVRGEFTGGGPLPYMPPARLGGLMRWEPGPLSAEATYRHAFAKQRVAENETPTGAYDLVGLSVGYRRVTGGQIHDI